MRAAFAKKLQSAAAHADTARTQMAESDQLLGKRTSFGITATRTVLVLKRRGRMADLALLHLHHQRLRVSEKHAQRRPTPIEFVGQTLRGQHVGQPGRVDDATARGDLAEQEKGNSDDAIVAVTGKYTSVCPTPAPNRISSRCNLTGVRLGCNRAKIASGKPARSLFRNAGNGIGMKGPWGKYRLN